LNKQSAIEWTDVILGLGQPVCKPESASITQRAPKSPDAATDADVLFALQLEQLTPGSSHVGGRYGRVVRCPRCDRSACFIGGRRYAHGLQLIRHWSSMLDANGHSVEVLDVRPEWESICVGSADHTVAENTELVWD
jgi:hypothetical protein